MSYRLLAVSKTGTPVFEADDPCILDNLEDTIGEGYQPRDFLGLYCAKCGDDVGCDDVRVDPKQAPADGAPKLAPVILMPGAGRGLRGPDLVREVKQRWRVRKRVVKTKETCPTRAV